MSRQFAITRESACCLDPAENMAVSDASYVADDLKRVRFVKRAQALGFSLKEVAMLLVLAEGEHCTETKALAEKKLTLVNEKIRDLAAMQDALQSLVRQCASECAAGGAGQGCPIIEALAQDPAEPAAQR